MEPDLLPTVCNLLLLFFVPSLAVYANLILGPRIFLSVRQSLTTSTATRRPAPPCLPPPPPPPPLPSPPPPRGHRACTLSPRAG